MSDNTPILSLPLLLASQAQKHVTHNEALKLLDILVQLVVQDRTRTGPPATPEDGDCHVVGPLPTGDWADKAGQIAAWWAGAWIYIPPRKGWTAWVLAESTRIAWNGTAWVADAAASSDFSELGVNTDADATNRLAVASDAALFTHFGSDMRLTLNKAGTSDTVSLLYQSDWHGHAEMGLAGDNDFSIKVSADGAAWTTALAFDAATGRAGGAAIVQNATDDAEGRLLTTGAGGLLGAIDTPEIDLDAPHYGFFANEDEARPPLAQPDGTTADGTWAGATIGNDEARLQIAARTDGTTSFWWRVGHGGAVPGWSGWRRLHDDSDVAAFGRVLLATETAQEARNKLGITGGGSGGSGTGDMLAATYDPNGVAADAFDMANMSESAGAKIMTAAERGKLAGIAPGAEVNAVTSVNTRTGAVTLTAGDVGARPNGWLPAWGEITGKPAIIAEGASKAAARAAIGAGTSDLQLGSTALTARAGNWLPAWAEITGKPAVIGAGATATAARGAIGAQEQLAIVPRGTAEAGMSATPYLWTAERVGQAIAALGAGGGIAPGGGSALEFIGEFDTITDGEFVVTGLGDYIEIHVTSFAVTAASATQRAFKVSTDNGATWETGNVYVQPYRAAIQSLFRASTVASANTMYVWCRISGFNTNWPFKPADCSNREFSRNDGAVSGIALAEPLNAICHYGESANFTGGSLLVFGVRG